MISISMSDSLQTTNHLNTNGSRYFWYYFD